MPVIKGFSRNDQTPPKQSDQHCKNSKHLAEKLKTTIVADDEIIISHDVVSLFTKTTVDVTLKVVEEG